MIDENDMQIIGDPNPDFYGNFSTSMAFKKVKFDALFTFSKGNDVYNYLRRSLESGSSENNQSTAMLSRWRSEGQVTTMQRLHMMIQWAIVVFLIVGSRMALT